MKAQNRNLILLLVGILVFISIVIATTDITDTQIITENISAKNITALNFNGNWNGSSLYMRLNQWNATNTSYLTSTGNIGNWTLDKPSYTLLSVLNNGSYLNPAMTDTFVANYSTFLTHVTNAVLNNGSYLNYPWNSTNTSYALDSELNNGSYLNVAETDSKAYNGSLLWVSQWNATNTSYYLVSNPNQYYNVTSNIGNWTADKGSYTLLSVLNNGSYFNTEASDTFIANYSSFLTHITWSEAMNGTIAKSSELNNGSYLNLDWLLKSEWNSTNTSYMTLDNFTIQNQSLINYILYVNSTNGAGAGTVYNDTWINSTIDSKISDNNVSVINWANDVFATIIALSDYIKTSDIINLVGNWSADKINYYTSTQVDDVNTSMKNYVDWVNSTNGAGSGVYDDAWINDTVDAKILIQNTSINNYIGVANNSLYQILMNGSFLNTAETDTFVANYSTFLTHITWANAMNGTLVKSSELNNGTYFRTSQWNATNTSYMEGSNFTIQNISMKNYVDSLNTSQTNNINTKLSLSGGTMTGNLNLSANMNLTMNGGNQIGSNATCVTIKGSTVTMLIC